MYDILATFGWTLPSTKLPALQSNLFPAGVQTARLCRCQGQVGNTGLEYLLKSLSPCSALSQQ